MKPTAASLELTAEPAHKCTSRGKHLYSSLLHFQACTTARSDRKWRLDGSKITHAAHDADPEVDGDETLVELWVKG